MRIEEIKKILKNNKKTYNNLSEACGIPVGTLRNIFSGFTKNPRLDTMEKIEEGLKSIIPNDSENDLSRNYITTDEEYILKTFRSLDSRDKDLFLGMVGNFNRSVSEIKGRKHKA